MTPTSIGSLPNNTAFEFENIGSLFRNTYLVYSTPSGALIRGQMRSSSQDSFHEIPPNYIVGLSASVIPLGEVEETKNDQEIKNQEVSQSSDNKRRGRKAKEISIEWPKGNFSVKDVLKLNATLKYHDIANYIKKFSHQFKKVNEIRGKGKPQIVYSLVS